MGLTRVPIRDKTALQRRDIRWDAPRHPAQPKPGPPQGSELPADPPLAGR